MFSGNHNKELKKVREDEPIRVTPAIPPTVEIHGLDPEIANLPVVDKILGCIYGNLPSKKIFYVLQGNALGDAWGLGTNDIVLFI